MLLPGPDALHISFTVVWVGGALALLACQGVFRLHRCPVDVCQLWSRVACRILSCPSERRASLVLAAMLTAGSAVLIGFGFATEFFSPKLPESAGGAVPGLFVFFLPHAFVEELFFRGVLIRKSPRERAEVCGGPVALAADAAMGKAETCGGPVTLAADAAAGKAEGSEAHDEPHAETRSGAACPSRAIGAAMAPLPDERRGDVEEARADGPPPREPRQEAADGEPATTPSLDQAREAANGGTAAGRLARLVLEPGEGRPPLLDQGAALGIFVTYHLDLLHTDHSFFRDARFLVCVAVGGLVFQEALLCSRSLWPGTIFHGLANWTMFTFFFRLA